MAFALAQLMTALGIAERTPATAKMPKKSLKRFQRWFERGAKPSQTPPGLRFNHAGRFDRHCDLWRQLAASKLPATWTLGLRAEKVLKNFAQHGKKERAKTAKKPRHCRV